MSNYDFSRLRSLSALRATREKLRWQIDTQQELLSRDWYGIRSMFSLPNLARVALGRYEVFGSIAMGGINSLVGNIKRRRKVNKALREEERLKRRYAIEEEKLVRVRDRSLEKKLREKENAEELRARKIEKRNKELLEAGDKIVKTAKKFVKQIEH